MALRSKVQRVALLVTCFGAGALVVGTLWHGWRQGGFSEDFIEFIFLWPPSAPELLARAGASLVALGVFVLICGDALRTRVAKVIGWVRAGE